MVDQSINANRGGYLERLPPEIRISIWKHLIGDNRVGFFHIYYVNDATLENSLHQNTATPRHQSPHHSRSTTLVHSSPVLTAFETLRTIKPFTAEIESVFYENTQFGFGYYPDPSGKRDPQLYEYPTQRIQHLRIPANQQALDDMYPRYQVIADPQAPHGGIVRLPEFHALKTILVEDAYYINADGNASFQGIADVIVGLLHFERNFQVQVYLGLVARQW